MIQLILLRNLKRLKVHSNSWITSSSRVTSHLYLFEQLEQLELEFDLEENCYLSISHPNLRIVSIHGDFFFGKFDLNTEKLEVLRITDYFDSYDITYPSSIKHLTAPLYSSSERSNVHSFVNLEYLHVCCTPTLDPTILTQLRRLKELKFVTKLESGAYELIKNYDDYIYAKQTIIGLIRMKQTLQREELKLYFDDVPLTGVKQFKIFLRDEFPRFNDLDSDESMDEDDVNLNDEVMEVNGNNNDYNNGNNGEGNGGDQDVII